MNNTPFCGMYFCLNGKFTIKNNLSMKSPKTHLSTVKYSVLIAFGYEKNNQIGSVLYYDYHKQPQVINFTGTAKTGKTKGQCVFYHQI